MKADKPGKKGSSNPGMDDKTGELLQDEAEEEAANRVGLSTETYAQLKRLAHFHLRTFRKDMTLNCTSLVHEAFLKLRASEVETIHSEEHYAAVASMAMRQILVDYVRKKAAKKHGGDVLQVTLQESSATTDAPSVDLLALDDALEKLSQTDPVLEKVVVLRFFGGFSIAETAAALSRSVRSVERDWTRARLYLYQDLHLESSGSA